MIFVSALMVLLAFTSRGVLGDAVFQTEISITIQEGQPVFLPCRYKTSESPYLFWYVQHPNESPQILVSNYGQEKSRRGFAAHLDKKMTSYNLTKDSGERGDSAVYFCALSDPEAGYKIIFGKGTLLVVKPNIEDSEPSVYKLKPRKGDNENLSACLITDYSPGNILAGLNGSLESISSSFVITSYGASYGTIVWDDKPGNFSCSASHKGKTYSDLTEDADGPPVEEFETDERLNFISITVLGLRVIFLKSVAINLLLTFRLWSC